MELQQVAETFRRRGYRVSVFENRAAAGYARTMDTNPADTILHFIAKITDAIEFPVGDESLGASSTSRGSAGRTGARAVDNFLLDLH